ncbi:MAG: hypothetical protein DI531_09695 [Brevundimonas sp.]|jgi:hypothetical protein|uniref:hypothetical protein n=1 Tax=Brevundimonas TaxID=41275 RepID=UPI000DB171DC|nr:MULTISPECIES: hypothetical protein [Brevundimonas]MBC1183274.1 hypothetical protein [Brevundimonas huaxiensis]PZU73809.1 MAG: hypothetical protein DI531_09695 [Brevundimonas sp.]
MKSFAQALHSDDRYRIMMIDDPVAGLRPITFEDHHGMVARLRLPITAPEAIQRLYGRALHALLYGWFDYELMVVACGQALATLEFSLKMRLGKSALKLSGLKPRLDHAVKHGLIAAPSPSAWGDDHALLASIRNEIAHGSDHVYPPNMAEVIFDRCRVLICEVYGLPESAEGSTLIDASAP